MPKTALISAIYILSLLAHGRFARISKCQIDLEACACDLVTYEIECTSRSDLTNFPNLPVALARLKRTVFRMLMFSNRMYTQLNDFVFRNLSVVAVDLSSNALTSIRPHAFANTTHLARIFL
jgi:hypothetical protein